MTASGWNWALAIVGTLASLAGFVFSWLAWKQAKLAKIAAEEATKAANTRNTAHEFSKLAADAKELLSAVQEERSERAISAANNLVHELQIASSRRKQYLPPKPGLESALRNLRYISRSLSTRGLPADRLDLGDLIDLCLDIHQSVCKIAGVVDAEIEGAGR